MLYVKAIKTLLVSSRDYKYLVKHGFKYDSPIARFRYLDVKKESEIVFDPGLKRMWVIFHVNKKYEEIELKETISIAKKYIKFKKYLRKRGYING